MSHLPITHQPPSRGSFSGDTQSAKDRARPSPPGGAPLLRSDSSTASGNAANTMQHNSSADDQTTGGTQRTGGSDVSPTKAANGSSAAGDPAAGVVEPFSELLARQIDETGSITPITVQDNPDTDKIATTENTVPVAKETQDQTTTAANAPSDMAGILAAMLQQIPATRGRGQSAEESNPALTEDGSFPNSGNTTGLLPLAGARNSAEPGQIIEGGFQQAYPAGLIPPSAEVSEHAGFNPASLPQTGTAQPISPSAFSAVMPGTPGHSAIGTPPTITTPLGSNVWAEEFTQKISWMCTQRNQLAELHLNPPNLGPLDVMLKISGNQATVLFTSPHGAVREAVENALPKLREILADNGIMLGNATVSDQSPQDRSADGNMNQGFGTAAQRAILDGASNSSGSSPANAQTGPTRRHNGMVDTFA